MGSGGFWKKGKKEKKKAKGEACSSRERRRKKRGTCGCRWVTVREV